MRDEMRDEQAPSQEAEAEIPLETAAASSERGRAFVFTLERFEAAYCRHRAAVYRYAVRCVGRPEIAEEIVGDAFVALFKAFDTIDEDQLPGWLLTVIRNRSVDYWRRQVVERRWLGGLEPEPIAKAAPEVEQWVDDAPSLKPVHRACVVLRYVHGYERHEISALLGLSDTQVKGHLQYARQLLRKDLVIR
jgi:RNA polymerase sigma-70 factor (ECF subfamily)